MSKRHLIVFLVIVFVIQLIGGFSVDLAWYQTILKPIENPPSWLFGPVWTILYIMIAFAGAKIYETKKTVLLYLYFIQLLLNGIWSWLFFGMHSIFLALLDLILLWSILSWLMISCFREAKKCGWILLPYYFWVCFALYLNIKIWWMNQ